MILVDLPSRMACDEPGCSDSTPVDLALMGSGGFVFRPHEEAGKGWQVLMPKGNPLAPFLCRCPQHKQEQPRLQVGPAGPRLVTPNGEHLGR